MRSASTEGLLETLPADVRRHHLHAARMSGLRHFEGPGTADGITVRRG